MEATVIPAGWRVRVFQNLESLSRTAAELFSALSQKAIAAHGRFSVAISGGSTPLLLYTLLGLSPWRETIDWKHVHLFWADERCVPAGHRESNFKLADDTFIARATIPDENIHRIAGEIGADHAALKYEQDLCAYFGTATFPVFDLILLGIGEDGHMASLFPGNAAVQVKDRFVAAVPLDAPRLSRVTLTLPVLNHAAEILFLVAGSIKAGVVQSIVEKNNQGQSPAGLVHPEHGAVTWFLDAEAASLLTKGYS